MSNLMPERRVDKTGKSVTRHVKVPTTTASAAKVPPPQSTLNQDAARIAKILAPNDKQNRAIIAGRLIDMNPRASTMQLIKNTVDGASRRNLDSLKTSVMIGDESYIRRVVYFNEVHSEYSSSVNTGMVVKYVDPPTDDDGNEAEIRRLVAMAHGISTYAEKNWMVTGNVNRVSEIHYEYNDEIDLFVTHSDRALELSRYMLRTRGEVTIEDMRSYLETHPALVDGFL